MSIVEDEGDGVNLSKLFHHCMALISSTGQDTLARCDYRE